MAASDPLPPRPSAPESDWIKTQWTAPDRPADATNAATFVVPAAGSSASSSRVASWVAFITGTQDGEDEELRELLRPRLVVGLILALLGEATYLSLYFGTTFISANPTMATLRSLFAVGYLLALAWLWRRPDARLVTLRAIEVFVVASLSAEFAANDYLVYLEAWTSLLGQPDRLVRFTYAYSCLNWTCLMFAYAVIIPNTPRRGLLILSALALMPFAIALAAWATQPAVDRRPLLPIMLYLLRFMLIGSVVAWYGSRRIARLRQEAFEARRLGQYQLKALLGQGGMGAVWLAEHRLLKRPCAVKLISADQAGDPAQLRRFEREVKAMAGLSHWNTAEVFDYGRTPDGAFYYVMEFIRGLSLYELIKRHGPLPPGRVIYLLRQVCAALREAHGQGLIHRDIKPSNVMITQVGRLGDVVKLLDFGLVQGPMVDGVDSKLTGKGIILGTPDYLSPEQASGSMNCDARSDIYSLGALAYWLLTARPPFVKPNLMDVFFAHLHETPEPPSRVRPVPRELESVVMRCLAKDAVDRFQDIDALDQALSRCPSAGEWGEAQAEAWWAEHGAEPGSGILSEGLTSQVGPDQTSAIGPARPPAGDPTEQLPG